jgi:hypothetical protein
MQLHWAEDSSREVRVDNPLEKYRTIRLYGRHNKHTFIIIVTPCNAISDYYHETQCDAQYINGNCAPLYGSACSCWRYALSPTTRHCRISSQLNAIKCHEVQCHAAWIAMRKKTARLSLAVLEANDEVVHCHNCNLPSVPDYHKKGVSDFASKRGGGGSSRLLSWGGGVTPPRGQMGG